MGVEETLDKANREENKLWVPTLIGLVSIIGARVIWQVEPGLSTFLFFIAVFWAILLLPKKRFSDPPPQWGSKFLDYSSNLAPACVLVGILSNMTVILANGGYMPVVGDGDSYSIWVTATNKHNLLFLADRFAGFSLGDFFLIGGLIAGLVVSGANKIGSKRSSA